MTTLQFDGPEATGQRLDAWLSRWMPDWSRNRLQQLIRDGLVRVDGEPWLRPGGRLRPGARLEVRIPPPQTTFPRPEAIDLDILYEDVDILVVNKPAGLVVHPAPGHSEGTLVNALLHHCRESLSGLNGMTRPGIVHRLDKDTSGVLLVAKTDVAMLGLREQFLQNSIRKEYQALVHGIPVRLADEVSTRIARHPRARHRMDVCDEGGRVAVSAYRTLETFPSAAWLQVRIRTGRTHQIRVHMRFIGHPVLGDPVYGRRAADRALPERPARQMLHAWRIGFRHPVSEQDMTFTADVPDDMRVMLAALRGHATVIRVKPGRRPPAASSADPGRPT